MKIKVLTYNIHKGFGTFGIDFTLHEIKKALQETGADLLFLQEVVGENKTYEKTNQQWPSQAQFEFLADSIWPHHAYGKNASFDDRHHGNAILSRFPILSEENLDISNHRWEQRGLLHCEIEIPQIEKVIHLFNVHLDLSETGRKIQNSKIIERIQNQVPPDAHFLLGGDFNDWNQTLHHQLVNEAFLQESHTSLFDKPAKSFPSFYPALTLDRIYFRNLKVIHCATLNEPHWIGLSDHLPLLVEFQIPS